MARRQMELSNEVAAELAGSQDHILRSLEQHLACDVYLRGNVLTLDGDADAVRAGASVVMELTSMVERGQGSPPRRSTPSRECSTSTNRRPRCSRTSCGAIGT